MNAVKNAESTYFLPSLRELPLKWLALCLALCAVVLFPVLQNGWTNWDDAGYVLNNPLVKGETGLGELFTTPEVMGNYHPLTLLSLRLDHALAGTGAGWYHAVNLILHLLNTGLVFAFAFLITRQTWAALIAALLFGIHPMHIESVAWISARKDLLYTAFSLLGLLAWMYHRNAGKKDMRLYAAALVLFLFALLSKGMAVVFPLILLALDYALKRKMDRSFWLDKLPFFALALIFGVLTIQSQESSEAMGTVGGQQGLEPVLIGFYGLTLYTMKAMVPYNLSAFHPYGWDIGEPTPAYLYLFVLPAALILFLLYKGARKRREIALGGIIFVVALLPVLQILPVGQAIIAERYTYFAYIGLFLIAGWAVDRYVLRGEHLSDSVRKVAIGGMGAFVLMLCVLSFARAKVWKDSVSLWENTTQLYPEDYYAMAYLAKSYEEEQGDYAKALEAYTESIRLRPDYDKTRVNRGLIFLRTGRLEPAAADFSEAIRLNPDLGIAWYNRGITLLEAGNFDGALRDLNEAVAKVPELPGAWHKRGFARGAKGDIDGAMSDMNKAISLDGRNPEFYKDRAIAWSMKGQLQNALNDFSEAIRIDAAYGEAWFRRSVTLRQMGRPADALKDALEAQRLGYPVEPGYLQELKGGS